MNEDEEDRTKNWTNGWEKLVQWCELCNIRLSWNENCRKKYSSQFSKQLSFPSSPMVMNLG